MLHILEGLTSAYDVVHISIQIPFFDDFVKRPGDTVFSYLHLTTARNTYTLKVEIPEYNALIGETEQKKQRNQA